MKTSNIDEYSARIQRAIISADHAVSALLRDKSTLENTVLDLKNENAMLREQTKHAISQIDSYLLELEEIRRNYGSRNNSN